ncbi:MAG: hypothetical protein HY363_05835 [Candidatus Aenigmarchaeota archaeon]|nr:hypothetical protein [Candidatus Aenigmarchaeota archaeon]
MTDTTTIQLTKNVLEVLNWAKEYPRQTYNELVKKMAEIFVYVKKRNQCDEFLHKIQQPKMKELWNDPSDEAWECV